MKRNIARLVLAALAASLLAGCTIQPLHAPVPRGEMTQRSALAAINIKPVNERVGQELRNHLIFLFNGGAGQPSDTAYELTLDARTRSTGALLSQSSTSDGEPTARTVTVTASYDLVRIADGSTVSSRDATASASFDVSLQEFANIRAERDAENRAAREVAERLYALIAADLKRAGAI